MKVSMAVNLSAVDLLDLDLPGELDELIGEHGVDPLHVCLEITESTIMTDPERSQAVLNRLAEIGVRLAIDDFGTGHSSLSYIKNLPVHEVKIDKSFVIGMAGSRHERTIVRATIDLAHALGLEVVAEGVETKEAHDTLAGWGCDMAQGYLYGRPQPATAFVLPRREPDHVEAEPVDAQARNGEPARLAAGFPLLAHRDAAR
jgi:EAL domain-containing protein (putative c-di-GMP-specific phosphodiesterase class I)